jgi:glycerol-3-phosphate cytidylyltransferase
LTMYHINVRILGEEYRDKEFTGKDICRKRDIDLYFNKRDHRFSSSDLRKRVTEGQKNGWSDSMKHVDFDYFAREDLR